MTYELACPVRLVVTYTTIARSSIFKIGRMESLVRIRIGVVGARSGIDLVKDMKTHFGINHLT